MATSVVHSATRRRSETSVELALAASGFVVYFCAYAFRKPFLAAEFQSIPALGFGVETKTLFVLSQVIGYAISKFLGVRRFFAKPG